MTRLFAKETDLVEAFCDCLSRPRWSVGKPMGEGWTQYHETAGWDLLLVHSETGLQVGIEAKLGLNAKVLSQALPSRHWSDIGPDYRAVLVPSDACQLHMTELAGALGITVLKLVADEKWDGSSYAKVWGCHTDLPRQGASEFQDREWFPWLPTKRETLPDYVPDVRGGSAAPLALTEWKIKAIKLMILLERRGAVHRSDMKVLGISPTRWTDRSSGYLDPTPGGYVRSGATPDLRTQHPQNWAEIEADFDRWNPYAALDAGA